MIAIEKLLIGIGVVLIALPIYAVRAQSSGPARAADDPWNCGPNLERCDPSDAEDNNWGKPPPPRRVTVIPSLPPGPPPLGWVYGPYTMCGGSAALLDGRCECPGRRAQCPRLGYASRQNVQRYIGRPE
jgi:hypothetical protein